MAANGILLTRQLAAQNLNSAESFLQHARPDQRTSALRRTYSQPLIEKARRLAHGYRSFTTPAPHAPHRQRTTHLPTSQVTTLRSVDPDKQQAHSPRSTRTSGYTYFRRAASAQVQNAHSTIGTSPAALETLESGR